MYILLVLSVPRFGKSQGTENVPANFGTSSPLASCLRPCWRSPPFTYLCPVLLDSYIFSFSRIRETAQSLFILTYHNIAEFAPHTDEERASTSHSLLVFIEINGIYEVGIYEINFDEKMRKDLLKFNCRLQNDLCKFYAIFNKYCFIKDLLRVLDIQNNHFIRMPRFTTSAAGLIASFFVPSQVRFLPFAYLSPVLSHPTDMNKWMRFRKLLHWTAHR